MSPHSYEVSTQEGLVTVEADFMKVEGGSLIFLRRTDDMGPAIESDVFASGYWLRAKRK